MQRPAIRIEEMTARHLPACGDLVDRLPLMQRYGFTSARARQALSRALANPRADLRVARIKKQLAGFSWFVLRGAFDRSGYLRLIVVGPTLQSSGVGTALMDELERTHLQQGGVVLLASAENPGAQRFYRRRGYRQVGTLPGYVLEGVDELVYYKGG